MASIPSLAIAGGAAAAANVPKLEADLRKLPPNSVSLEKTISYESSTITSENSGLDALPRHLDAQEALAILQEGAAIDEAVYVTLLLQCIKTKSVADVVALHGSIIKTGTHEDLFVGTHLVTAYMKCGRPVDARNVFDKMGDRNIVTWTTLITGYNHNAQPELGIEVFLVLLEEGRYPTHFTLGAALSACAALGAVSFGEQVHGYAIKYGAQSFRSTGNSLCGFYAKCRRSESAMEVFKRMSDKDVISWTTMISVCADEGNAELGLRVFVDMLMDGDVVPNEFTLTSALSLCCMKQDLDLGKQVHAFCVKFGYESNVLLRNSTMYLYLKSGKVHEAERLVEGSESVNLVMMNAMMAGHARLMASAPDHTVSRYNGMKALRAFQKLNTSGGKPDFFSYSTALKVCSGLVDLEQGEQMHAQATKRGLLHDVVLSSALVNMYNKCGSVEKAAKAFDEISTKTLVSWTAMLTGYSQHGQYKEAIQLFEDMRMAGVKPNQITFVGVLSACSHAGLADKAEYFFNMMKDDYGIKPVSDHYACLVDMYVRLGRLEEAFALVNKMDTEPSEVIWCILLSASRSNGNMELALYAAERLLQIKPKRAETYMLIMNMYILAHRWQDVSRVKKMIKQENIGTIRDRSWISIKKKVHSFKANSKSHPQASQIFELLDQLIEKAKGLGYAPYKGIASADEEHVEEALASASVTHHSEKLAVACGLINTPEGAPIRVLKNFAMCRDCHVSIKLFSVLTNREIIIRDSRKLHRFKDGQCSCGDFGAAL